MGQTWPNPAVGCVIVNGGRVVGRGHTQPGGRPHAEPQALEQAGALAKGATVYVSLEPCAHHGKTPPCAEALIAAGVSKVFFAIGDPDARVAGRGAEKLRAAGIEVVEGPCAEAAARDHAGFLMRETQGRPFVTLKLAISFDGRIATGTGHSQWITGPEARRAVHGLRARHDAVVVGGGTARADDPMLTVRGMGITRQPVRVVVSRRLDIPLMGQLARSAATVPLLVCHGTDADPVLMETWQGLGATLLPSAAHGSQLAVPDVLSQLAGHGLTRVFCEGGGALAASLLAADCVDQLVGFTAGFAIGAEGVPGIGALGLDTLERANRFELDEVQQVGADVMHVWRRR
jgi:diaminohydroxyphosphoribosylaminopyrimidine deaminase/5-amino-6-(5-phosphoribosylamino)uracil reductase